MRLLGSRHFSYHTSPQCCSAPDTRTTSQRRGSRAHGQRGQPTAVIAVIPGRVRCLRRTSRTRHCCESRRQAHRELLV
eukprot:22484_5